LCYKSLNICNIQAFYKIVRKLRNNPNFKGGEFDPLLKEAGSNLGFQPVSILQLEYFFQNFLPKSLAVSKRNRNFVG
jgi:hypothetical protein